MTGLKVPRLTTAPPRLRLDDVVDLLLEKGVDAALPGFQAKAKELEQEVLAGSVTATTRGFSPEFAEKLKTSLKADLYVDVKDLSLDRPPQRLPKTSAQAAVLEALAQAADASGYLSAEGAEKALGKEGRVLFSKLEHLLLGGTRDVPTTRPIAKWHLLSRESNEKLSLSARRKDFAERMPAMGEVSKALGGPEALRKFSMTSIQHLFPSSITLYDQLEKNGVQRRQMGIEGKPYSASRDVVHKLHAEGFHIHDWGDFIFGASMDGESMFAKLVPKHALVDLFLGIDPQTDRSNYSDEQLRQMVLEQIPKWEKSGKKFLLLDDGGSLVKALHELFPEAAHLCVGVEQTMSGANALRGLDLKCPVVNMAESALKKTVENKLIGESVASDIEREAREAGHEVKPKIATILGYGAVGKGTAEALRRRGYEVHVWDTDPKQLDQAKRDGFAATTRDDALAHAHLLVGCTGKTSLDASEIDRLPKGAVLANAGSGNYELGTNVELPQDAHRTVDETGLAWSELAGEKVRLGEAVTSQIGFEHKVVNDRLVLRGGYVVNMTRDVPPEYAQLIRGMLLASCLQAAEEKEPGLRDLSQRAQEVVREATDASLKAAGLSLEQPDFTRAKAWDW